MAGKTHGALFCGAASLALMLCANAAHAADGPSAAAVDDTSSATLGEVIVTAAKRSESIQKVGASITALGVEAIQARGVVDLRSLSNQVPSLSYAEHDGGTFVTIRGVGASVDTGIAEPSVATYVDGVFLPRSTMGALNHEDLARIEVLRGPQGTLYGRNATGGAINFISAKPEDTFGAGVTASVGNYGHYSGQGYITGPIAPGVSVRLSAGAVESDGYVKNILNGKRLADKDDKHVRGALHWQASPTLSLDLSVQYSENDGNGAYQQLLTLPKTFVPPTAAVTLQPWRVAYDYMGGQKLHTLLTAATINWSPTDQVQVRSITGYIHHTASTSIDGDATSFDGIRLTNWTRPSESFSQEFNVFGDLGPLKWLVGGYYFHENYASDLRVPLPAFGILNFQGLHERTESAAIFANASYAVTSRLRLIGGLRYNYEKKNFVQTIGNYVPQFVGTAGVKSSSETSRLLPKAGAEYDFTSSIMGYAHYQIGYKSGGQNLSAFLTPYSPETLQASEIGLKSKLAQGAVILNLSAFHYDYRNLQVLKINGSTNTVVENGDARIDGAEAELTVHLTRNLTLNAAATVLDAEFKNFASADPLDPTGQVQNLAGKHLVRSPPFTGSLGLEWVTPLQIPNFDRLSLRGELFVSAAQYLRPFNTKEDRQKAYTLGNLYAVLPSASGKYQLRAFVTNIGNIAVKQEALAVSLTQNFVGNYAPPRMYGFEVSAKF